MEGPTTPTSIDAASSPLPSNRRDRSPRTTSQSRINDILETARQRSIALEQSGQLLPMSLSPSRTVRVSEQDGNVGDGTESSADERTSIVQRESRKRNDYQSTSTSVRSRNSQTTSRRPGQEGPPGPVPEIPYSDEHESWWKKQLGKLGSVELENKGSVARDHLALERTFLAWLRTSLAFASIGIAITQLFRLNTSISGGTSASGDDAYLHLRQLGKPLGATFLGISILVLFVGFHRYFESQHWIIKGKFPASRGGVSFIAAIAFALMVTSLIVVLVAEPTAFEKRRK